MADLFCGLYGSRRYCDKYPGLCCQGCPVRKRCKKACLNGPDRCGQARGPETAEAVKASGAPAGAQGGKADRAGKRGRYVGKGKVAD